MKIKSILFILVGLIVFVYASTRAAAEILPALNPTSTPDVAVLESYAPNTGPLASPVLSGRKAASGETESQPVMATLTYEPGSLPTLPPPLVPTHAPQASGPTPTAPAQEPAPSATSEPPSGGPAPTQNAAASAEGPYLGGPVEPDPLPTPAEQKPAIPDRIVIPSISLDAPVTLAASQKVRINGQDYYQWLAPNAFAAGWHTNSAYLGYPGNTVLDGHHNIFGRVFGRLVDLNSGDKIFVYSGEQVFSYSVTNKMILPERDAGMEQRLENARWIGHSADVRLTLITCWPADSNTHRLIIVATPDQ